MTNKALFAILEDASEFSAKDKVYHRSTGEPGIVLCTRILKSHLVLEIDYLVSFGPGNTAYCLDSELSRDKIIV